MKDLLIGSTFAMVVAFVLCTLGWACWQQWGNSGYERTYERGVHAMASAYEEGQHAEVLRIYETRQHVPLYRDVDFTKRSARMPSSVKVHIAGSYLESGNREEATSLYLSALGWSASQYQAYCGLVKDCQDITTLRRLAGQTTHGATR